MSSEPSFGSPLCVGHGARCPQDHKDEATQTLSPSTSTWAPSSLGVGVEGSFVGRWREYGYKSQGIGTLCTASGKKGKKWVTRGPGAELGTSPPCSVTF